MRHTFQACGMKAVVVSMAAALPIQLLMVMGEFVVSMDDDYNVVANGYCSPVNE